MSSHDYNEHPEVAGDGNVSKYQFSPNTSTNQRDTTHINPIQTVVYQLVNQLSDEKKWNLAFVRFRTQILLLEHITGNEQCSKGRGNEKKKKVEGSLNSTTSQQGAIA